MLKQPIYVEFNLDAKVNSSKLIAISHVDDKYSEVLEVAVKQNDRFVYMGGATVIARMVLHRDKDYLLSDTVPCTVNDNGNILIPFDNAVVKTQKGVVKIEVNITRDTDELTLQFPLWVSVNGSILDNAEVTPESEGTIPDLLKEAADALEDATKALDRIGSYNNEAIPYSVKLAMDTLFSKAAYADDDAASSYATFHAWAFSNLVTFITAVFTQGSATIHDTDSLDTLKQYLTVTATHPDSTTSTVTDYTLSGTLTEGTSTITVSYGGKTTTFTVTVTADPTGIHDEYQKVEWIEANHAPVIDTLFVPSVNTEIHAGIQFIDSTAGAGSNNCVFGSTTPSVLVMGGQSTMLMNFARQSSATASNALKNSVHDVVLNKDTCTVDGVTAVTFSGSPLSFTTPRHMMIFAFPKDDNQTPDHKSHSRCSYFQAYDNGVLAADLVPCYRKADGVIGMYDRVAQAFRTNVGTGTFTKGGDVT